MDDSPATPTTERRLLRGLMEPTPTQREHEALMEISMNLLTEEMDEDQMEHADYEGAYNLMIRRAREALP